MTREPGRYPVIDAEIAELRQRIDRVRGVALEKMRAALVGYFAHYIDAEPAALVSQTIH